MAVFFFDFEMLFKSWKKPFILVSVTVKVGMCMQHGVVLLESTH